MSSPSSDGRGSGTLALVATIALVAGLFLGPYLPFDLPGREHGEASPGAPGANGLAAESEVAEQLWSCGMHPHVLETEPGQCPICGMNLTPIQTGTSTPGTASPGSDSASVEWTCPDHEQIVEAEPGTCPIDGQDLEARQPEPAAGAMARSETSIQIDPAVEQKMNVRLGKVRRLDLTQPIRTVGYMEYDQQRMVTVTPKYSGWIEKVYVNYVGEKVTKNEPLFEIYSPELVQTERELLSALRFADELADAPEDVRRRALSLVDSARLRLGYWDISEAQIQRLEETGEVFRTLEVRAPATGLVMKKMSGLEGMAVQPGMQLFHLADLSSLWLEAEFFEDQIAWIREGMEARIELSYFPGEQIRGKVRFLEPALSEETRTLKVKIEVPNRDGRLRKGMYATVELDPIVAPQTLAVPVEAILRSGTRNVVVVAQGEGRFAPREITLGIESGGLAQVLSGLSEGTDIVTSAQFLLDSESSLQESIQKLIAERSADNTAQAPNPGETGR